jgi:hypothetical protein
MSDTRNVRLGVCKVFFDGDDLGYTQGGVEVAISTETHKTNVDQFGKTAINEYIMGRNASAKVPLAETTIENMVRIMPGATIVQSGGAKAAGTITVGPNPTTGQTVIVNGKTITFKTAAATADEVTIGANAAATAAALAAKLNASTDPAIAAADYTVAAAVVTATYQSFGTVGNAFTLAAGTSGATVSGATLTGGVDSTKQYVEVTHGVGQDLLASAKELRLHPTSRPDTDKTEDFVFMYANTPGALNFAYKLDAERIFNVEFTGYPDPVTGKLFRFGDDS